MARGEVRPDVCVEVARELGQAILWHRFLITGDEITEALVEHIVDDILLPYTASPQAASTRKTGALDIPASASR